MLSFHREMLAELQRQDGLLVMAAGLGLPRLLAMIVADHAVTCGSESDHVEITQRTASSTNTGTGAPTCDGATAAEVTATAEGAENTRVSGSSVGCAVSRGPPSNAELPEGEGDHSGGGGGRGAETGSEAERARGSPRSSRRSLFLVGLTEEQKQVGAATAGRSTLGTSVVW